jgi:hypothetical protein
VIRGVIALLLGLWGGQHYYRETVEPPKAAPEVRREVSVETKTVCVGGRCFILPRLRR